MAMILLGLACILQVVDSSAGWRVMRDHISDPSKNIPHELTLKNPFWDQATRHYQRVELVPPQDKAPGWEQIALYAAKHHLATNAVFFARVDRNKVVESQKRFIEILNHGSWKPDSLYILQSDLIIPAYFNSNPDADLLIWADGFAVLAPNWKRCTDCPKVNENLRHELDQIIKGGRINQKIQFGRGQLGANLIIGVGGNWSWPEQWGVWSNGDQAKMILPIPRGGKVKQLRMNVRAFVTSQHPSQNIEVLIDNIPPQRITLTKAENNEWVINLPSNSDSLNYLELVFHFKNPASPKDVGGVPGDDRRLGMGLISAQFQ